MLPEDSVPASPGSTPDRSNSEASRPPLSVRPVPSSQRSEGMERMIQAGLTELDQRRRTLEQEIEQLERRKTRLEAEMRRNFAGASQDLAIRVQGFKDYLVGSLQDLATAAEQLELAPPSAPSASPSASRAPSRREPRPAAESGPPSTAAFGSQRFEEQRERVRSLIDQYRTRPDYYGPPWQIRRTFEADHADKVKNWFFTQGGRGAVKSMGSRLQNVVVASAAISVLYTLYGNRMCCLVLANTPERLGEWRRWLQDCLGISRADFGTQRGIMLFESTEPLAQRAERLLESGRLPMIVVDDGDEKIALSALRFPLWLAFAPDPMNPTSDDYYGGETSRW
ncbi:MAG: DUF3086 domain-containing protein [Cyanobacteria bacterium P01_A01_bin.105]